MQFNTNSCVKMQEMIIDLALCITFKNPQHPMILLFCLFYYYKIVK